MIKRQFGKVLRPFVLLISLLSAGCAQQMKSVQPDAVPEAQLNAELKSITVADDASRIEILSDKPIVYTYYMLDAPPRLVVDLAQTTSGSLLLPIEVNRGSVKRIEIARHEFGGGVLSRIDVLLADKVEVVAALDQQDKNRLILNIPVPPQVAAVPVPVAPPAVTLPETVLVVDPQPVAGESTEAGKAGNAEPGKIEKVESGSGEKGADKAEKAATVAGKADTPAAEKTASAAATVVASSANNPRKPGERGLTAIIKNTDSIQLVVAGEIDSFKAFKLNQPERLVIDIPGTRSMLTAKVVDINSFNLGKARVGGSPEKLRIVFDAVGATIPAYSVTKNDTGLLIAFGEALKKSAAENSNQVEAKAAAAGQPTAEAKPVASAPVTAAETKEKTPLPAAEARPAAVEPEPVASHASQPAAMAPVPGKTAVNKPSAGIVEAVEFTQAEGISRITVRTSGNCNAGQPVTTGKGLFLSIKDCRLPQKLQRQLDTSGFESAIRSIAPYSVKGKTPETRIAVTLRGTLPNSLKRDGDTLRWEFTEPAKTLKAAKAARVTKAAAAPPQITFDNEMTEAKQGPANSRADRAMEDAFQLEKASQPASRQGKAYSGRKVTLEFSDADIRKIFQLLAEVSNQNFLVSDDVSGTISLKLVNVPWDQALDVILENKGLGMQREGNIVQIRPKTKMKSLDDEAIEQRFTEEKKMPLSTVIFDINFATLGEIQSQFNNMKSKRLDASISTDMRTNKIIVTDIDPNIRKMRALLGSLDVPEKQVMIEARIVEASSTFARDIGVKWNFGYTDGSASVANINNATGSMGGVVSAILPTATTGGIATGVSFGKLLSNLQLDMRLSAASSVGQVKIISTPKVMTVNNKPAKISQGQMIPYQNTSSTDGAKTEFIEAALSLEVTPHITADGSVSMRIKASNNTAGVGSPPPINKKEATTELVVKNGETTVIGGIFVDSETDGDTGVPYLSDIPLLGWMFKSNSKNKTKNEMLIFITPKIMN